MHVHVPKFYLKSQVCNVVSEIFKSAYNNDGWKIKSISEENKYLKKKLCLQPEFGMHIKTPPQNRKPMALIETSIREFEPDRSLQASKCRTEGVGNEDGACFKRNPSISN